MEKGQQKRNGESEKQETETVNKRDMKPKKKQTEGEARDRRGSRRTAADEAPGEDLSTSLLVAVGMCLVTLRCLSHRS